MSTLCHCNPAGCGQAFLLAGSIFGLDLYIDKVKQIVNKNP